MDITPKAAGYLLRYYPSLWNQIRSREEDTLEGGAHGDYSGSGRVPLGVHSDPTTARALALAEVSTLAGKLEQVREWIDTQLYPGDRSLLLEVWRSRELSWRWTARQLSLGVSECLERWSKLVEQLSEWLIGKK